MSDDFSGDLDDFSIDNDILNDIAASDNSDLAPDQLLPDDGSDAPAMQRASANLLDRLLYKGVLPRYAFPTDVASFYIFDKANSTRHEVKYLYAPSQGLSVALTQYAPGRLVWVDGREWRSGAIYSPFKRDRYNAWENRKRYFECHVCRYARCYSQDEAEVGDVLDCPACGGEGTFGKAMNWMRPPGFAHPVEDDVNTTPDDQPTFSYATRANLVAGGPKEPGDWISLTEGIQQTFQRETLLVTNTGSRGEGYRYCTKCGLIEPMAQAKSQLIGPHKKPFPDLLEPDCPGSRTAKGLVLGTDFISDVLLVRLTVRPPLTLRPDLLATEVALRTIAEALTIAATYRLEIEETEIQAEFRPALVEGVADGLQAEIYLYDTLAGGAGFTRQMSRYGQSIFEDALERLEQCPADCDESCYKCLRSFRNRFEHPRLDRRLGASLLRYLLYGEAPVPDQDRLEQAANRLFADLESRGVEGVTFERGFPVSIPKIGELVAPILASRGDRRWIIAIRSPLTRDLAPTPELNQAKDFQAVVPVLLVDELVISRNLPAASEEVRKCLT